ncbi:MAG TPA: fibronectin type III domain-containing protein [Mariniphaga sp.]|nr:fibronectin type III domain-containing protein [Mariniphaga sp.]
MKRKTLLLIILLITGFLAKSQNEPLAIFLTWTEDPTSTISIDWHNHEKQSEILYYKMEGEDQWKEEQSKIHPFPFSDRLVHRVALQKLRPGTSYQIRFGDYEKVYSFKTMPENTALEPIRIAIGGDTMHDRKYLEKTNSQVLNYDPHFVIMGGDLAYENGAAKAVERVHDWFEGCKNTLITKDNRIIPIVVGIGNHEVAGGYYSADKFSGSNEDREEYASYFYRLFAFPGHPGYNILDFGNYLSLFILDTEHANPIPGKQTEWLESELEKRKDVQHLIPVYHIPAYPSVRNFNGSRSKLVRQHWLPLFEKHKIKLAFENHDHAYKRTFPIRRNEIDGDGIVFVGDGAWGVNVREVHKPEETWYLKKAYSQRHFILLTIQGNHQHITTVNEEGEVIDTYPELNVPY